MFIYRYIPENIHYRYNVDVDTPRLKNSKQQYIFEMLNSAAVSGQDLLAGPAIQIQPRPNSPCSVRPASLGWSEPASADLKCFHMIFYDGPTTVYSFRPEEKNCLGMSSIFYMLLHNIFFLNHQNTDSPHFNYLMRSDYVVFSTLLSPKAP